MPNADGSWRESILHNFRGSDGANPYAPVAFDRLGNLYGTAGTGGASGYGVVFELSPVFNGTWRYSVLHSFSGGADGSLPDAGIAIANPDQLYGTTYLGGEFNNGLVFGLTRTSALGWHELVVYPFTGGNDGGGPIGPLTLDANGNIYGTTFNGGTHGAGVVFKLSPNHLTRGWTETVLYSFQGTPYGKRRRSQSQRRRDFRRQRQSLRDHAIWRRGTRRRLRLWDGVRADSQLEWHLERERDLLVRSRRWSYPNGPLIFDQRGNLYVETFGHPTNYGER